MSAVPLVWGQGLIAWLDDYPYSCTEQLVSKGMSALILTSRPEFGAVRRAAPMPPRWPARSRCCKAARTIRAASASGPPRPRPPSSPRSTRRNSCWKPKTAARKFRRPCSPALDDWLTRFASTPAPTLADGRWRAYAVYLLARQGIKPNNALSNVEQELSHRYPQAWPTDLSAGMARRHLPADAAQRRCGARSSRRFPGRGRSAIWSDEIYYDPVVHDAQLLYLLAQHFPARLNAVPPTVLEDLGSAASGNRVDSLSAAWTLLALDAYAKAAGAGGKLGISEIGKDGREQRADAAAGRDAEGRSIRPTLPRCSSARKARCRRITASTNRASTAMRPPPRSSKGSKSSTNFSTCKGNPITQVKVGEEFLVRLRLRATKRDRRAADRGGRSAARRNRGGPRIASARRQQHAGADPAAAEASQRRLGACRSACPTNPTGCRSMSTSATTAWCSTATSPRTPRPSSTACAPPTRVRSRRRRPSPKACTTGR